MSGLCTLKNSLRLCSIGIIAGFCAGVVAAGYTIFTHNYLSYKFYVLAGGILRDSINSAIGVALLACLCVAVVAAIAQAASLIASSSGKRPVRAKQVGVALFCLAVFVAAVAMLLQQWNHSLKQHLSLVWHYDIFIMLGVCLLGWVLIKMPLGKLFEYVGRVGTVLVIPVLIIAGLFNAVVYVSASSGDGERPNILLISIDDLRADHMGCYGYQRDTTPNMDAFARDNVLFTNAFVHEPWTLTSHMSLLTGLYPITHGVYNWQTLDAKIPTLAEYLKNAGYATIATVNSIWLQKEAGFGRGFDKYSRYKPKKLSAGFEWEAQKQNRYILDELSNLKRGPFFAFIHYYDVHSDFARLPYNAPEQFKRRFISKDTDDFPFRIPDVFGSDYLQYIHNNKISLSVEEREHIIGLYDSGIAYMDFCIGDLLRSLRSMGLYDNTLIIITADHGEEIQEHGGMLHSNPYYYDVLMRVPLLVKLPDGISARETVIESLVELIDIKPSILDYLNIQPLFTQGESFRGLLAGEGGGKDYVYGLGSKNSLFIRSKKWKLMSDDGLNRNRYRLYNVEQDPQERHDIIVEYPDIEKKMEEKLRLRLEESMELRARMTASGSGDAGSGSQFDIGEEEKARLRSLGYVL